MRWYQAPAKVNFGLWVGPRDSGGYHPVDSIMQGVAFSDQLYIESRDYMLWETTSPELVMDAGNLVVRAYAWAKARIPTLPSVYGRLEKVTWVGAGLGGGSSDAAAVIRWAFEQAPQLKDVDFLRQTAELGMDVPFFIRGGAARAQGYGQELTPVPSLANHALVLVNPGVPLATQAVYAAFDTLKPSSEPGSWIPAVAAALTEGERPLASDLKNSLEDAAFLVLPSLRDFRDVVVGAAGGMPAALSGSGPTYYILGSDEEWAEWMARRLKAAGMPRVQATMVSESW